MLAQMPGYASSRSERSALVHARFSALYDPSDLSTLFQDAAGTTPVTADSEPVGLMRDVSGNANHATQSTAAARPLYRTAGGLHWLAFDGVDDRFEIAIPIGTGFYMGAAIRQIADTTMSIFGYRMSGFIDGRWAMGNNGLSQFTFRTNNVVDSGVPVTIGSDVVLSAHRAAATPGTITFSDGTNDATVAGHATSLDDHEIIGGPQTYENQDRFFNGRMYGIVIASEEKSLNSRTAARDWLNGRAGL